MASRSIVGGSKTYPTPVRDDVVRIVVLGRTGCGKTTLIRAYYENNDPSGVSAAFGLFTFRCSYQGPVQKLPVEIIDIPDDPEVPEEQRHPYYAVANIIVFLHAVDDPSSFRYLVNRWVPEIIRYPFEVRREYAIVGTKDDLRNDEQLKQRFVRINETFVDEDDVCRDFGLDWLVLNCSGLNVPDAIRTFRRIIERSLERPIYRDQL